MSFIDDSKKNVKKYTSSFKERKKLELSLKEVTGGSVAGFVGTAGMSIDALFAGPFHPDSGHGSKNKKLLAKQLKDRREKRKDLESNRDDVIDDYSGLPDPVGGYYETDTEFIKLAYDELMKRNQLAVDYSIANTPEPETEWKSTGWDYEYDKPGEAYKVRDIKYDEPGKAYTKVLKYDDNSYNNPVVKEIEYDDNSNLYADDTYINKSATNWEYIEGNK